MVAQTKKGPMALKDLGSGAVLQCLEALTLGMPFEVWKTRMGRYRGETTPQAFVNVYKNGGGGMKGVMSFWAGLGPKMVESATKGGVLLLSKEGFLFLCVVIFIVSLFCLEGFFSFVPFLCCINFFFFFSVFFFFCFFFCFVAIFLSQ